MAKKNKSYWQERHAQWIKIQDKADDRVIKKLRKDYQRTAKELEKEIARYFKRYGRDDVIQYRIMLQELNEEDKQLLYRDMGKFAERYPKYAHLMSIRESIYQLNRLQGLHYTTQLKLLELGAIEQETIEQHLLETYGRNYSALMKELNIGYAFLSANDTIARQTIYTKWVNGEDFSDRIWNNKEKLLNYIYNDLRDGLIRGDNYDKMIKKLMDRMETGEFETRRLIWTESAFVLNQAHAQPYKDLGLEEYEINAIIDSKTSDICRSLHGERFRFDDMRVGVNYPPFHPWCRTTIIGVLNDFLETESQMSPEQLLPNYENAVIPEEKFTKYALDPDGKAPDKAIAFEKALGYNKSNYQRLISNVKRNLPRYKATLRQRNQYGQRYQVIMRLTGLNGKTANVLTSWIVDARTGETRLTSIYVTKKEVEK